MTEGTPQSGPNSPRLDRLLAWFPGWMSERERAALILAVGMVIAAVVLAIGIANVNSSNHSTVPQSTNSSRSGAATTP